MSKLLFTCKLSLDGILAKSIFGVKWSNSWKRKNGIIDIFKNSLGKEAILNLPFGSSPNLSILCIVKEILIEGSSTLKENCFACFDAGL